MIYKNHIKAFIKPHITSCGWSEYHYGIIDEGKYRYMGDKNGTEYDKVISELKEMGFTSYLFIPARGEPTESSISS